MNPIETLVSLPPAAARLGRTSMPSAAFACSDPPGRQLGSGGGTAHLLLRAWKNIAPAAAFGDWLAVSRKLIIHASGQSRRLPAYAAEGKLSLPVPVMANVSGQKPGQTLLDVQQTAFTHILRHAPESYRVAVTCGDTLVRCDAPMPRFPEADVLIIGIPSSPEEASAHGVLFTPARDPGTIEFFLQKPSPDRIRGLSSEYSFSLDSGVWLLSERAVRVLMRKCGLKRERSFAAASGLARYELYDSFGTSLGRAPECPDAEIGGLSAAVLPLPDARFYHFGTNRSVLASVSELCDPAEDRRSFGHAAGRTGGARYIINSRCSAVPETVAPLWIENSFVPASWTLGGAHVITGVPENGWTVDLPAGVCVDSVPFERRGAKADGPGCFEALRVYGFDDAFKGALSDSGTLYLGRPFSGWLAARGLDFKSAGLKPDCDIQDAPLFPIVNWSDPASGALLRFMAGSGGAAGDAAARDAWLRAERVSATDIVQKSFLPARVERRTKAVAAGLAAVDAAAWPDFSARFDLKAAAAQFKEAGLAKKAAVSASGMAGVHGAMFLSELGRKGEDPFAKLSRLIVDDSMLARVDPARNVMDDQIVWGRSPARIDLAGGWSDTPPYCIKAGGRVVNAAIDLNGQPPIQVFARLCREPALILHSIDLGLTEKITTFRQLCAPSALGPFSIPRAALRLAGFDPRFRKSASAGTLEKLLVSNFGGGIEISTLAAIPKGSGLGTSSILAATALGVIGDFCSMGWTQQDLFDRTTALEQLLTSGGGWQDQLGGIVPGVKLATTRPGLRQEPDIRFLPGGMMRELIASGRAMLYYTGITRVARSILADIVRSFFLNSGHAFSCVGDIACNADFCAEAIQRADDSALAEAIRRSWDLNRELDSGTRPTSLLPLTAVLDRYGAAYKLLGAGGGGYMFALAPDIEAASRIREELSARPLNARARFVSLSISSGLQITRS